MDNDYNELDEIHEPLVRWITFQLGEEIYGVEVNHVREILRVNYILPVAGAPDCILGITNIRGNVVSVIDGRKRLNMQSIDHTPSSRMIVFESENDLVAVIVDRVSDVIDFPESSLDSNPNLKTSGDSKYVKGVITHDEGLIIVLNTENLVTEEQFDNVAGF